MERGKWWIWSVWVIAVTFGGCAFDYTPPQEMPTDGIVQLEQQALDSADGNGKDEGGTSYHPPPMDVSMDVSEAQESSPAEGEEVMGDADTPSTSSSDTDAGVEEIEVATVEPVFQQDSGDSDNVDAETETDAPFVCVPQCQDKQCGDDDCGGKCGQCPEGWECNAAYFCQCVLGCPSVVEDVTGGDAVDVFETTDADTAVAEPAFPQDSSDGESDGGDAEVAIVIPPDVVAEPDFHQDSKDVTGEDATATSSGDTDAGVEEIEVATVEPAFPQDSSDGDSDGDTEVTVVVPPDVQIALDVQIPTDIPSPPGDELMAQESSPAEEEEVGGEVSLDVQVAPDIIVETETVITIDTQADEVTPICIPDCTDKQCGQDGCGGFCGVCPEGWTCDEQSQCENPCDSMLCDDLNPCTDDSCDPVASCQFTPNTLPCSDGNACTTVDICQNSECKGGQAPDCNDNNPCTDDWCNPIIGCQYADISANCDDNNKCTADSCDSITGCQHLDTSATCKDGNLCTDDGCTADQGCVFTNNTASCEDDFNVCTTDVCQDGVCAHPPVSNDTFCDDGSVCTILDICQDGKCTGTAPLDCDDEKPCTLDVCHPVQGCQHSKLTGTPCNDNNACTTVDICQNGLCLGAEPPNCDDNNKCTADSCDPVKGCQHLDTSATCIDGNLCTDDGCTSDQGCVFVNNTNPCNDNNVCTLTDTCSGGTCLGANPKTCQDFNPCTDDTCNAITNCQFTPNTASCDDNNQCTDLDTCGGDICKGTNKPNGTICDDGIGCTKDECQFGFCQSGSYLEANFDDGSAPKEWKITSYKSLAYVSMSPDTTSQPYLLEVQNQDIDSWTTLDTTLFTLNTGHTAQLVIDKLIYSGGIQGNLTITLNSSISESVILATLTDTGKWSHNVISLNQYVGIYSLSFKFTGFTNHAIDTIKVGCQ